MNKRIKIVGGGILGLALLCGLVGSQIPLPIPQGDRLDAAPDIVGVDTGGAYVWVVRTASGALLIDGGLDTEATAILEVLAGWNLSASDVKAMLLTHAHSDHIMAINAFPNAKILVDEADRTLLLRERAVSAALPRLVASLTSPPLPQRTPESFTRGTMLEVDGRALRTVHVPGHTLGSTAYVLGRSLFSGDAVVSADDGVMVLPSFISEDHAEVFESLRLLGALDVDIMLDGHAGITRDPTDMIAAFLDRS